MNLTLSEGGCRITRSRKQNSCELYGSQKERSLRFIQEKVQVTLGCMAIRTQTELIIRRVQFIIKAYSF